MEIPPEIPRLYEFAKKSFTLFEQGEMVQSTEAAYELRDVADHLITASQETNDDEARKAYHEIGEHILNITIDPLERATQNRSLRVVKMLRRYWLKEWLHSMPTPVQVQYWLSVIDVEMQNARRIKGRTDRAKECYEHVEKAYTTALNLDRVMIASLQNYSPGVQGVLAIVGILGLAAGIVFGVVTVV